MTYTQMNVRINDELKARGDEVFASLGLTPTEVVRAVWGFAAAHGEAPCIVAQALTQPTTSAEALDAQYRALVVEWAHGLVAGFREQMGVPAPAPDEPDDIDYQSMRKDAYEDRLAQRGLA